MAMTERDALNLWRRALSSYVRTSDGDLTVRQQAILMTVALSAGPHTVRGLASDLDLAKPAVTRALDALEKAGFVRRRRDEHDLRSVIIERTVEGMTWLREFAELVIAAEAGEERRPVASDAGLDKDVAA
ncbi:MarR family winged helix-turn-helix transcriptional regulator [Henriciella marina]|uniref:MarR family winged helix-turn-helix transcriptional regulator n=1 Tax=Henriciella marina TaxID=453851 RepID=UPI0003744522|nr:MarR family transcriptional regulator [Henriciella marina]